MDAHFESRRSVRRIRAARDSSADVLAIGGVRYDLGRYRRNHDRLWQDGEGCLHRHLDPLAAEVAAETYSARALVRRSFTRRRIRPPAGLALAKKATANRVALPQAHFREPDKKVPYERDAVKHKKGTA